MAPRFDFGFGFGFGFGFEGCLLRAARRPSGKQATARHLSTLYIASRTREHTIICEEEDSFTVLFTSVARLSRGTHSQIRMQRLPFTSSSTTVCSYARHVLSN